MAQGIFDAMFSDMDNNLREIGVSDLSVGRRMRTMWEAFHGRSQAYATAIDAVDRASLEASLARNVWRAAPPNGASAALAEAVLAQAAHLRKQPLAAFAAGNAQFHATWDRMSPELHRPIAIDRIGAAGLDVLVEATAAECAALAQRMKLPAVLP